ncbi:S49 family peptidase [Comamonas testosteroni]|jgi:protease-4|uniref:Peptidase S49 n=2 Tax=Comamonas testosteroni TaxID=285 RepID=B7WS43_COMTK|nr:MULTISPECIES: S49 family peptidase [Comamonas]AIJ45232.1 peptidase S49 [Comamonas testosteroni TK102]EED69097.1 peptidase S49 [Comamonas testosteroni KF-1]MPS88409.1 S49 family peptidase [Comamonas sp.]TYK72601.1 S49 family peptidase [Comamonas sp. Z3]WQG67086.1 S49 family peptidase [Comamonas testosteroni]
MSTPDNHDSQSHVTPGADLWSKAPAASAEASAAAAKASGNGGWERDVLEKLVFASIKEQRAARRWRFFSRLLWSVVVLLVLWAVFFKDTATKTSTSPHTAVVEIKGEIASGADASAEFVVAAMRSAFEDSGSRAVVLLINSPGGSPVQAGIINDEMTRLKAKYNKPLYAVVEESCASAAYYIAAAADEIFVDKASIVGSIGVLMDGFGFTGVMDKVGVERRLLTAGENKGFLDPFSPMSSQQKEFALQMLEQIHQQFIGVVKAGRGDRLHESPEMFSGLFWTGQQAVELGLADKLGSLDYVAREVVKAEEVIDYTRRDNVAERLAKRFGAAIGEGSVKAMRGLMPSIR